ncbi:TetR/AcrR family transcriptional regulator [Nesterenkonia populi]|uniref:TetR/AcrR family transcriptional regulator n=1 Tax=Nesterenkonia populi TaxID=1591087 RepID=UPI0011BFCC69|nr:TetR/AcrR family transcriptional regulator [Nesterenkonia populi]
MVLTRDRIVEAAYGLLREYGLQDISMRRISSSLDVRPGALYYHVPNKQDLLRLVARRALAPLQDAPEPPFELMLRLRSTLLSLRDGADLVLIAYALDPELPPVPALVEGLRADGAGAVQAGERAAVLMRCALGLAAVEQNARLFSSSAADQGETLYAQAVRAVLEHDPEPQCFEHRSTAV